MAGPPSLEEAISGLTEEEAVLVPQRLGEVGGDLGGSQARVSEQELDDSDVHSTLVLVRGYAVS